MPSIGRNDDCPCGSNAKYKKCCLPYLEGKAAPTPEALMRSRYSAYIVGAVDYLFHTTHPDNDALEGRGLPEFRRELTEYCRQIRYLGLTILAAPPCEPPEGDEGSLGRVHFRTRWTYADKPPPGVTKTTQEQEEHSLFVKEKGRWFWRGEE